MNFQTSPSLPLYRYHCFKNYSIGQLGDFLFKLYNCQGDTLILGESEAETENPTDD